MEHENTTFGVVHFFYIDTKTDLCDKLFFDFCQVCFIGVGADDAPRFLVGDAKHDHATTLVRERYGIFHQLVKIE